ncbi:hypothetical protein D3C73_887920 [compost metagenome]
MSCRSWAKRKSENSASMSLLPLSLREYADSRPLTSRWQSWPARWMTPPLNGSDTRRIWILFKRWRATLCTLARPILFLLIYPLVRCGFPLRKCRAPISPHAVCRLDKGWRRRHRSCQAGPGMRTGGAYLQPQPIQSKPLSKKCSNRLICLLSIRISTSIPAGRSCSSPKRQSCLNSATSFPWSI